MEPNDKNEQIINTLQKIGNTLDDLKQQVNDLNTSVNKLTLIIKNKIREKNDKEYLLDQESKILMNIYDISDDWKGYRKIIQAIAQKDPNSQKLFPILKYLLEKYADYYKHITDFSNHIFYYLKENQDFLYYLSNYLKKNGLDKKLDGNNRLIYEKLIKSN